MPSLYYTEFRWGQTATQLALLLFVHSLLHGTVMAADKPAGYLVQAKVTSVGKKAGNGIPATLEVVHVYSGPEKLVGQTFVDFQREEDFHGSSASAPFTQGEEGLWTLTRKDGELCVVWWEDFPFTRRYRKSEHSRYAQMVAVVEAIERVEKAESKKRFGVLKELTHDRIPEVSGWAIHAIGKSEAAERDEFFAEQVAKLDDQLPLAGQVSLDNVLAKWKGQDWGRSKSRTTMIRAWAIGKSTPHEGKLILDRLHLAHQAEELSDLLAVEVLVTAAGNKGWEGSIRRQALFQLGETARRGANDDAKTKAYEWMFDRMRKDDDIEIRRAAASSLSYAFPLYPARLKAVEEHLATEKDAKVAESLRAAVKKAKEADKK